MTPRQFLAVIVDPTIQGLAPTIPVTDNARVLTLAIAGQESGWAARRQIDGPARGYWQFEKGGGVAGLFSVVPVQLQTVCKALDIPCDPSTVFEAMAWNDTLACSMARLLLWTDPRPLPAVGDRDGAWDYYLRNWRPGMPHRGAWDGRYDASVAAVVG